MTRFATLRLVAAMIAGLVAATVSPAWAQDSFQDILQASATEIESKLQLSGDQAKQVDAILQNGVKERMAVLDKLGIKMGKKPSFGTLLKLRSQMDDIRTEEQTALSKILSEQQMFEVDAIAQASEKEFRAVLLGKK